MAADLNIIVNGAPVPLYLGENTVLAALQAAQASASADRAAASEAVALAAAGPNYVDASAGLAATDEGETFAVEDGGIVTVYRHDAGPTATELRVLPTTAALASTDSDKGAALLTFNPGWLGAVGRTASETLNDLYIDARTAGAKEAGEAGGDADQATAIQAALAYSVLAKRRVRLAGGVYNVSEIVVPAGSPGIDASEATIKGMGSATVAIMVLGEDGGDALDGAYISANFDMSEGDLIAIQGYATSNCIITGCRADGFTNHATLNHFGIRLNGECNHNVISDNNFELYDTPTQRGFGIAIYGTSSDPYGGFFTGTSVRATGPAIGNNIIGNNVVNGSYAISVQSCEFTNVVGNVGFNQNHRGMFLGNSSWWTTIVGNTFEGFTTGILLSYGSCYNLVANNTLRTTHIGGEAGVNVQTGSRYNLVTGNLINCTSNYGVYVGPDCIGTKVLGNYIEGSYAAHIAVENDWITPRPANNNFGRPNYEAPPSPYTAWSYNDLTGVVVANNVLGDGASGRSIAGVWVAQIDSDGATGLTGVHVTGNQQIGSANVGTNFAIYRMTDAEATGWRVSGNDWNPDKLFTSGTPSSASADWAPVSYANDNGPKLDSAIFGSAVAVTDGDTTPSVKNNAPFTLNRLFALNNTSATSITTFDDGVNGQRILLRLSANTTLVHDNAKLRLKGSTNVSGVNSNNFIGLILIGTVWFETTRNF